MERLIFSPAFQRASELLESGKESLFITGKAGTGKSTLLRYFLKTTEQRAVVLAPTGVAALNVSGETIHSFFRFKPSVLLQDAEKAGKKAQKNPLYSRIDMMIIDEVSMLRADLLDCIHIFLQRARRNDQPFGGLKMVFIGDLYQLSPVLSAEESEWFRHSYATPYFFSSSVIQKEGFTFELVELEDIYRQTDSAFIDILNAIRNNTVTDEQLHLLNRRVSSDFSPGKGIYLSSTNQRAGRINQEKLNDLPSPKKTFEAVTEGTFSGNFPTEKTLSLKVGARVMLLSNHGGLWVNGTMATIVAMSDEGIDVALESGETVLVTPHTWNLLQYEYDPESKLVTQKKVGSFKQYPLKPAWALTIHKSQGKTFDDVIFDPEGVFAHGQVYVALSRCRSLEGLTLTKPIRKGHIRPDRTIVTFFTEYRYALSEKKQSKSEKCNFIEKAIEQRRSLELVYLKTNDEKSIRLVKPLSVRELQYKGKKYLGLEAFCEERKDTRHFRIDRILEMHMKSPCT